MIREAPGDASAPSLSVDLPGVFALLRRERGKIARIVAAAMALSLAYALFAPRSYLSSADILVSARPKDILAAAPHPESFMNLCNTTAAAPQ